MREYTSEQLKARSHTINAFHTGFPTKQLQAPQETSSKVFNALEEWLKSSESRTLWLYGPAFASMPSELSSAAAHVVFILKNSKIPSIAHRCQQETSKTDSLIIMVYSLMVQLVHLVPNTFTTEKDFSADRFARLNGSVASLPDAMFLMEDLLTITPKQLICVIDGFQLADDEKPGTDPVLNFFVDILHQKAVGKVLKVLYTTDGVPSRLRGRLDPDDRVNVMHEAGKHHKTGRMTLATLPFPAEPEL